MDSPLTTPGFKWRRAPLLLLGAAALVAGAWTGLVRLGAAPAVLGCPMEHGPLMVSGFLGTVIALERAVAARAGWAFAGPLFCGAGTVSLLAGFGGTGAVWLAAGSAVVLVVLVLVTLRAPQLHHAVLAISALVWLGGNVLLALGRPAFEVVALWLVFLVGTIAAERLELTRVLPRSTRSVALFVAVMALLVVGALASLRARDLGLRVLGAGELGLALWLLRYDVARRTVKQAGVTRYVAAALLSGYAWLAVGGVLALVFGHPIAGPRYDAMLHAVFVGFVFSMIFGHAPIIVPAVLGVRVAFSRRFYVHLVLLHVSLVVRVGADLAGLVDARRAGAWGNVAAIAVFLGSTVLATRQAARTRPSQATEAPPVASRRVSA